MNLAPRAWDFATREDAACFLAPDGLESFAAALPLPCRAVWLPLSVVSASAPPPLRSGGIALAGRRGLVLCGISPVLRETAGRWRGPAGALLEAVLDRYENRARALRFADGETWDLGARVRIAGVVNVTPDSFSDGGRYVSAEAAAEHGARLVDEGADVLDIGAESTRPGAAPVSVDEELARLLPALRLLRSARPRARMSVDTRRAAVAQRALEAGADVVNDVTALADPGMAALVAAAGVPVVLMHMRGTPETMQRETGYEDVVGEVAGFLAERAAAARDAGIAGDRILLDPGLGFGKSAHGNELLVRQLRSLAGLGYPVFVGASRKAFLGRRTGVAEPSARLAGSVAAAVLAAREGAAFLRVHDVDATRQALAVFDGIATARPRRDERSG